MTRRSTILFVVVFVGVVLLTIGVLALLMNINQRQMEALQYPLRVVEIGENELDPAVWGQNYPFHYDRFMMTRLNSGETPYGGSEPYSKLERYPAMVRLWAGYAFSKGHNEERGHYFAQVDQADSVRVEIVQQPGACLNCHAAQAPQMIAEMGWEEFNSTPYNELRDESHLGTSCADCHDPSTMQLRLTRPALINALERNGRDVEQLTRQEMRTYVCAQCHVEYYFAGDKKVLTFPWDEGTTIDSIESYYNTIGFADFNHAESGAPMIKVQHPEYELYSTGLHARSNVSCADCHMPYIHEGGMKISDHWLRSPLTNVSNACQTCHNVPEEELRDRILTIQTSTSGLIRASEHALLDAIDMIMAAREAGATDEDLEEAWQLHRSSQIRWDFISSENSTGFHSPQEANRVLAHSMDLARQSQFAASQVLNRIGSALPEPSEENDEQAVDTGVDPSTGREDNPDATPEPVPPSVDDARPTFVPASPAAPPPDGTVEATSEVTPVMPVETDEP